MNGIMGMANLLLSTPQNDEQREYSVSILDSARHLLAIINDILRLLQDPIRQVPL